MQKNEHELVLWLAIGGLALCAVGAQFSMLRHADQEAYGREMPEFEFSLPGVILQGEMPSPSFPVHHSASSKQLDGESTTTRSSDILVNAIIELESQGNPAMVGGAGERGLMQLMPGTWSDMSRRIFGEPLSFDQAFNPDLNRKVGTAYLDYLQEFLYRNQASWHSDLRSLLLASYNYGPNAVAQAGFDAGKCPEVVRCYVNRGAALHDTMLEEEVAKGIEDWLALVDLDSPEDMRPMGQENVGPRIDDGVGQGNDEVRGVVVGSPCLVGVAGKDDEVGLPLRLLNRSHDCRQITLVGCGDGPVIFPYSESLSEER